MVICRLDETGGELGKEFERTDCELQRNDYVTVDTKIGVIVVFVIAPNFYDSAVRQFGQRFSKELKS